MTELKKFLFDFDFDDVQLMEEIDRTVNDTEMSIDDDIPADSQPETPTFSEEDLEAARKEGFAAGKERGVQETLSGAESTMCQMLDTIAMGISSVAQEQSAFNEKTEHDTLELALSICRKLFPALSEEGKLCEVSTMTKSVISQILAQPKIMIFTNADIVTALKEKIDPFLAEKGYEGIAFVMEDRSLPVSGCRIQWQDGQAVRNPETGLQDIEQIVSASLADQTQVANTDQGPNPLTELDRRPQAKQGLRSDVKEHFETSPADSTTDDLTS
ncbi:MAG: hypothetical protein CBD27_05150 [Rhodospirillaceae bacterium TMED167]|nr:hypothetical protein [Rhodospirillaceae bacterium]OUW28007.1 MAG: hypothetical protein CBD27_05150 [Rhodospirillaceae bacterium TMED167]